MGPNETWQYCTQRRPSISNPRAIAVEFLCLNNNTTWLDGELYITQSFVATHNRGLSEEIAQQVMIGAKRFVPLPDYVSDRCALVNIPRRNITRKWGQFLREFASYYLMNSGKYQLLFTACMLEENPLGTSDNELRDYAELALGSWRAWNTHMIAASAAGLAAMAR